MSTTNSNKLSSTVDCWWQTNNCSPPKKKKGAVNRSLHSSSSRQYPRPRLILHEAHIYRRLYVCGVKKTVRRRQQKDSIAFCWFFLESENTSHGEEKSILILYGGLYVLFSLQHSHRLQDGDMGRILRRYKIGVPWYGTNYSSLYSVQFCSIEFFNAEESVECVKHSKRSLSTFLRVHIQWP